MYASSNNSNVLSWHHCEAKEWALKLSRMIRFVVSLSAATIVLNTHAADALRCVRDGKVFITNSSCAAIGASIDLNQPVAPQAFPSDPQRGTLPPASHPLFPQATPPVANQPAFSSPMTTQPIKPPAKSGTLNWLILLVVLILLIRGLQKHSTRQSEARHRTVSPLRPREPNLPTGNLNGEEPLTSRYEREIELEKARKQREEDLPYKQAPLMSRYELDLFKRLRSALPECEIFPQVPLAAFIRIDKRKAGMSFFQNSYRWQNRISQQRVDFLVCLRDRMSIVAAVELDDPSHDNEDGEARDRKKDKSLEDAGVPLIRWRVEAMPSVEEIQARFGGNTLLSRSHDDRLHTASTPFAVTAADARNVYL